MAYWDASYYRFCCVLLVAAVPWFVDPWQTTTRKVAGFVAAVVQNSLLVPRQLRQSQGVQSSWRRYCLFGSYSKIVEGVVNHLVWDVQVFVVGVVVAVAFEAVLKKNHRILYFVVSFRDCPTPSAACNFVVVAINFVTAELRQQQLLLLGLVCVGNANAVTVVASAFVIDDDFVPVDLAELLVAAPDIQNLLD